MADSADTDHLFQTKSVDEVATFCRETQREIAATQDELRKLIGSQYRELLDCCDLVVGMDDVCAQIQVQWAAIRDKTDAGRTGQQRNATRGHASGDEGGAADDRTVANELQRAAFASVCLFRSGRLQDGVIEYKRAITAIHELQSHGAVADDMRAELETVSRMLDMIPHEFSVQAETVVARLGELDSSRSASSAYDDLHMALEQWHSCGRNQAAEHALALHKAVLVSPEASPVRIVRCAMRGLSYLATTAERAAAALASTSSTGLTLAQLNQLDTRSDDFEAILFENVCGLHSLVDRPPVKTSLLDGWVSPMPPAPPALDAKIGQRLVEEALQAYKTAAASTKDVTAIAQAQSESQEALKQLLWSLPEGSPWRALAATLDSGLSAACIGAISDGAAGRFEAVCTRFNDSIQAVTKGEVRAGDREPQSAASSMNKAKAPVALHIGGTKRRNTTRTEAAAAAAGAEVKRAVDLLSNEEARAGLCQRLDSAIAVPIATTRRFLVALRGMPEEQRLPLSLHAAFLVRSLARAASDASVGNGEQQDLSSLLAQLNAPWATAAATRACDIAKDGIAEVVERPETSDSFGVHWTDKGDAAQSRFPVRASAWTHRAVLTLNAEAVKGHVVAEAALEGLPVVHTAFIDSLAAHVAEVAQGAMGELNALQLYFDLSFLSKVLLDQPSEWVTRGLAALKGKIDPTTASLVLRELVAACETAATSSRMLCHPAATTSGKPQATATRPETRRLPQARDAPRISNVPLPTAPKALSRLAAEPGTSDPRAAADKSSRSGTTTALRSLRSIMGSW